jgi:hypothetical protein
VLNVASAGAGQRRSDATTRRNLGLGLEFCFDEKSIRVAPYLKIFLVLCCAQQGLYLVAMLDLNKGLIQSDSFGGKLASVSSRCFAPNSEGRR